MINRELTPIQVARLFDVSPQTVRRWERRGFLAPRRRLPDSKIRRYDYDEVMSALALWREAVDKGEAA